MTLQMQVGGVEVPFANSDWCFDDIILKRADRPSWPASNRARAGCPTADGIPLSRA